MVQDWKGTNEYLPSCPPASAFPGPEELPVSQEALTSANRYMWFFPFCPPHPPTVPLLFIHLPAHLRVFSL